MLKFSRKKNLDLAIIVYSKRKKILELDLYPDRYLLPVTPRFRTIDFAIASLVSIGLKKILVLTSEDKETLTNYLLNNWPRQNFTVFDKIDLEHEFVNFFYDYIAQNSVELISIIRGDFPIWFDLKPLKEKIQNKNIVVLKHFSEDKNQSLSAILKKSFFTQKILPLIAQNKFSLDTLEKEFHPPVIKTQGFFQFFQSLKDYVSFHNNLIDDYLIMDRLNTIVPICPNSPISGLGLIEKEGCIINSLIGDQTEIRGRVENSVIFPEVKIDKGCEIKDSIILPGNFIGKNTKINKSLIMENFYESAFPNIGEKSRIGNPNCTVVNSQFPNELNFSYTLIGKNSILPPQTDIGGNAYFSSPKMSLKKQQVRLLDGESFFA